MIKLTNINLTFNPNKANSFHALKNINLKINKGELVILKGVSGSGKSTLLSLIAALIKPSNGQIEVNQKQVAKLPDLHASQFRSNDIGFIFQSFNLFESLSVAENITLPLIPLRYLPFEIEQKVSTAMLLANIAHKKTQQVKNLSGGEKQRTAIARALVNDPQIILCDEPTANLDQENTLVFIEVLQKLKSMQKTIIIATHDPIFEQVKFIDRVVQIENGEIL
ncbi:MAG: ABC transporter ATP-binding protein [Epsilonproteobacteria bacterium]|nr:ABC transporter ATP-binding protein [Campylobacterota bacterium]